MRIQKVIPGLVQTKENYWSKEFVTHMIIVHYCKLYLTVQQSYMEIRYIHGTYTHSTLLYTVQYCTAVQYRYIQYIILVYYCTMYSKVYHICILLGTYMFVLECTTVLHQFKIIIPKLKTILFISER